jgi:hypothetical protein
LKHLLLYRSGIDGLLKIHSPDNKRSLLPHNENKEGCSIDAVKQEKENEKCFKAGIPGSIPAKNRDLECQQAE